MFSARGASLPAPAGQEAPAITSQLIAKVQYGIQALPPTVPVCSSGGGAVAWIRFCDQASASLPDHLTTIADLPPCAPRL